MLAATASGEVVAWHVDLQADGKVWNRDIDATARAFLCDSAVTALCSIEETLIAVGDDGRVVRWVPAASQRELFEENPVTAACAGSQADEFVVGVPER